jgi:hypothetical protein
MDTEVDEARRAPTGFRHWKALGDGFLLCLVVVGPAFLFEELWRGRPMIDQGGGWWLVPACIMAIGFFAGGRVSGRGRRAREGAFKMGLAIAALTLVMIFIADVIRRSALSQGFPGGVLRLWVLSAVAALVIGGLGGVSGRRGRIKAQQRHQMGRFH